MSLSLRSLFCGETSCDETCWHAISPFHTGHRFALDLSFFELELPSFLHPHQTVLQFDQRSTFLPSDPGLPLQRYHRSRMSQQLQVGACSRAPDQMCKTCFQWWFLIEIKIICLWKKALSMPSLQNQIYCNQCNFMSFQNSNFKTHLKMRNQMYPVWPCIL